MAVMPPSPHRKTGKAYRILRDADPLFIPWKELEAALIQAVIEHGYTWSRKERSESEKKVVGDGLSDEIKRRITLFDLGLKQGLQPCPLPGHKHGDQNPSLSVKDDGSVFNCFAQHGGGDVFNWIMLRDGCDFKTALQILADRADVKNPHSAERANCILRDLYDDEENNGQNAQKPLGTLTPSKGSPVYLRSKYTGAICGSAESSNPASPPEPYPFFPLGKITPDMVQPPKWVIDPYIPLNAITVLGGSTRNFKTTVGLYAAAHIAAGKPLWGLPTEQQTVLWIDEESGLTFIYSTLMKIISGWTDAEKAIVLEKLSITPMQGVRMDRNNPRLFALIESLKPQVIFVDALRRVYGGDESTSDVINSIFTITFKPLLNDGATLILLHHNRKRSPDGRYNPDEDEADMLRGSGDIPAMSGSIIALTRLKNENKVIITQPKLRAGKERDPHLLEILHSETGLDIFDNGIAEKEQAKTILASKDIVAWLISKRKNEVKTGEIKRAMELGGYKLRIITDAIRNLRDDGMLDRIGKGRYMFNPPRGVNLDDAPLTDYAGEKE